MILLFRNPVIWMLLALLGFIAIAWLFSYVLTPYIISILLAYCLTPLVNKMERFGLLRAISGVVLIIFALGLVLGSIVLAFPIFVAQVEAMIVSLPDLYNSCLKVLRGITPQFIDQGFISEYDLLEYNGVFKQYGAGVVSEVASYASAVFDLIFVVLIVPIITFYLLVDWNKIIAKCSNFLPHHSSEEINQLITQIDSMLTGFIRGQLLICTFLVFFYCILLSLVGLTYGLLIGVFAGLISFIPFLGAGLGVSIALSVAIYQFWDIPVFIGYVAVIFLFGQILESNFLTPKLIGSAVRLHPVLIMLSVSIGGALAGLSGVLLAIPVAGILAVLLRQLAHQYLASSFFKGIK